MNAYLKLIHLQKLSNDLNWKSKTWKQILNLTNQNLKLLLKQEKLNESKTEKENRILLREFIIDNIREPEKSRIVDRRYLSSWELEVVFRSPDWEFFTKIYWEDDYFFKKSKARDEKQSKEAEKSFKLEEATARFWN